MNNTQPTIALLSVGYMNIGGIESHLQTLARLGAGRYHLLYIGLGSNEFNTRMRNLGVKVIAWSPRSLFDFKAYRALYYHLRQEKVDLVHIHEQRAGMIGRIIGRIMHIPTIMTNHGPSYHFDKVKNMFLKRWLYIHIEGFMNKYFTNRVIYVAQKSYDEAVSLGAAVPRNAVVIRNGVARHNFQVAVRDTVRNKLGVAADIPLITYAGRLSPEKGPDIYLQALAIVAKKDKSFRALLIGDGPENKNLEEMVRVLFLADVVSLLGFRDDILSLLSATDIYVLPSRYENMSVGLLEALASGCAAIVTDVGDNSMVVRDGVDGIVVPAEDPNALAQAMCELIADPKRCTVIGVAALERSAEFDENQTYARVFSLYDELIEKKEM